MAVAKWSVEADAGLALGQRRPPLASAAAQHRPVSSVVVIVTTVVIVAIILIVRCIERVILAMLPLENRIQKIDILNSKSENLVLGELFVRRMRGHEAPQLSEGAAHVLLPPALPGVGEDLPDVAMMPDDTSLLVHLSKADLEDYAAVARFVAIARGS